MTIKVAMISTFGPNIRGVSPYADDLASAINSSATVRLSKVDFERPFPAFILPSGTNYEAQNELAMLDYLSPRSWDLAKRIDFEIAHLQYWSPAYLPIFNVTLSALKRRNKKIVITWHNPSPHESIPLFGALEKRMAEAADLIICHSEAGVELLKGKGFKSRIEVCHHGCDTKPRTSANNQDYLRCQLEPDRKHLLFFGNIRPYKGLDVLLDAWQLAGDQLAEYDLVIAGRLWGEQQSGMARLIHKLAGTSSHATLIKEKLIGQRNIVTDFNFIEEEKLNAYLRIADLAIFPYTSFESQSGAATRAAGCGIPIISTDVGGLTELLIDPDYACESHSPTALARCLVNACNTLRNDTGAKQISRAGLFSWERAASIHEQLYMGL